MSALIDEAHEFLCIMDKQEYADEVYRLRARVAELEAQIAAPDAAVADDGKLWSFLRDVLSQGAAIAADHAGKHYELYSARLDAAAKERGEKLSAILAARQPSQDVVRDADNLALAYGVLWHVNNIRPGYDAPADNAQLTPEKAAYKARHILRDMLTRDQRGDGINRASALLAASGRQDGA